MRYVAFLRAINVGGHAVIRMSDLAAVFEGAGCRDVRTYIQSGNVIFTASETQAPAVFRKVTKALARKLGKAPGIMFRTADELARLVKRSPFVKRAASPDETLYVVFLSETPARTPALPLMSEKDAVEAIAIQGLHVFMVSRPAKDGRSSFPNAFAEKALGVPATSRNWNTVIKIVDLT